MQGGAMAHLGPNEALPLGMRAHGNNCIDRIIASNFSARHLDILDILKGVQL